MADSVIRTIGAALAATFVAWLMGLIGMVVPLTAWTDRLPTALVTLATQPGTFLVLALIGFTGLRLLLKTSQPRNVAYLGGGAVVGLVAAVAAVAVLDLGLSLKPGLIIGGLLSGLAGGVVLRPSARARSG